MDTDTINKMLERKGKNIFLRDCGACHGGKEKTDNYLAGVVQRVGKNYLGRFITNQDSLVSIKDHYAMKMKEEYVNLANSHNFKYSPDTLAGIIEDLK